ncbi:syntaxin-2 isoform X2 [Carassius auratus]|uniref:Syntaxin-2 isoform X2 n=1 Tax=Carassius auratus TaxID=7957 RepID=A0A6P6M292_CARAU|nr:syntaxin-2-like isoform X2 [Carassius auratus]
MKDRLGDLTALCHDIIIIAPVESSGFLEEFLLKVNEVQQLIERISLSVEEVKLRHSTLLTEINPPNYVREELEQFSRDIKQTADLIKVKLKDLEGKFSENENANSSSVYCRIQSTQHTVLSLRFAEIMNMYNQELLSFRTRSKDWIQRQLEISGKIITEEETEVLLQSNNPAVFTSNGEMANNIAKTVMKAENYVDQGKENMVKAVDYKKSWRIRLPLFKSKAKPATSKGS